MRLCLVFRILGHTWHGSWEIMGASRDSSVRCRGCDNSSAVFRTLSRPQLCSRIYRGPVLLDQPFWIVKVQVTMSYIQFGWSTGLWPAQLLGSSRGWEPLHVHFAPSHEHFFPSLGRFFKVFGLDFRKIFVRVSSLGNTPLSLSCRGYTASAIDSKLLYGLHRANPFLQLLE